MKVVNKNWTVGDLIDYEKEAFALERQGRAVPLKGRLHEFG